MIFCHCAAVTDSTIARLIADGARTVPQIVRRCGAGRRCAPCREELTRMLYVAEAESHTADPPPRHDPLAV